MEPLEFIRAALPLKVDQISITDPVVNFSGEGWWLTAMCPWTLQGPGFVVSWEDDDIEIWVMKLMNRSIISVSAQDLEATDPTFCFDGGFTFSVVADTDLDPWWFHAENTTFVGHQAR